MLLTFEEVSDLIESGVTLHIAGTERLLRDLPRGNWIGGTTEYFMTVGGGEITNDSLFVNCFPDADFKIANYGADTIANVAADAYDNGFSIVVIPFESRLHKVYAHNAAGYEGMFIKNIVGWISGANLDARDQTPLVVNGQTGEVSVSDAVVLHLSVPENQTVNIGIINIFEQDESTPVIEFGEEGFTVDKCLVNGEETVLADYIARNNIDTRLPLVGDYSGAGVNISFRSVGNGTVSFYAPVFKGIKYRIAKPVSDYAEKFNERLTFFKDAEALFTCNCIMNFIHGELEGAKVCTFFGPVSFGQIAYQLVNQALVYVTVLD